MVKSVLPFRLVSTWTPRLTLTPLIFGAVFSSCTCDRMRQMSLEVELLPTEVVPAVTDSAVGWAEVYVEDTESSGLRVPYYGHFSGVRRGDDYRFTPTIDRTTITAVHVHAGTSGTNGPVLWAWTLPPGQNGDATTFGAGSQPNGYSVDQFWNALRGGPVYLDVHTTRFPNGHLRGRLSVVLQQGWYCPGPN